MPIAQTSKTPGKSIRNQCPCYVQHHLCLLCYFVTKQYCELVQKIAGKFLFLLALILGLHTIKVDNFSIYRLYKEPKHILILLVTKLVPSPVYWLKWC